MPIHVRPLVFLSLYPRPDEILRRARASAYPCCLEGTIGVCPCLFSFSSQVINNEFRLLSSGKVVPVNYSETFTLDNLAEGLGAIEQRQTWGKAIVKIQEPPSEAVTAKL